VSHENTYDFIVVGAGSSGCVTANRLVEEHGARVLLLEAGPPNKSMLMKWPAGAFKLILGKNKYTKRYESEPQDALDGRTITEVQGSTLGGSSSVNVNAYLRGSKADYAKWTEAAGGFGWGWDDLVPIFRRQEANRRFDNDSHGGSGPLKVGDPLSVPASSEIFMRTMQRRGLSYQDDFGAGDLSGVGFLQTTIHEARRCSAADAFLEPVLGNERLTVLTSAEVQKVRFDGTRAVGVDYLHRGKPRSAQATAEVILAAGPLVTPKLLMLSGVGPQGHLAEHGIDCIADSPGVGENFHDHPILSLTMTTNGEFGFYGADKGIRSAVNAINYLAFRGGPIAANGSDAISFLNLFQPGTEPNVQIYCLPILWPDYREGPDTHGVTLMANFVQPRSRGRVWLRSTNPTDGMAIDFNWLSEAEDRSLLLEGFKELRRIAATEPFASMVKEERMPGPAVESDDELMEMIRRTVRTNYHPVGTCKMGSDDDPMAVLTPDLRVRGVEGLRVFDVSMMPEIVSSATNATAMAVAERGVNLMMDPAGRNRNLQEKGSLHE
jgi:choline dehydrogenase